MLLLKKQSMLSAWIQQPSTTSASSKLEKDTKIAEIRLATAFAEHSLSLATVDHLGELFKNIFYDSKIAQNIALHRTKCTSIIKKCYCQSGSRQSQYHFRK